MKFSKKNRTQFTPSVQNRRFDDYLISRHSWNNTAGQDRISPEFPPPLENPPGCSTRKKHVAFGSARTSSRNALDDTWRRHTLSGNCCSPASKFSLFCKNNRGTTALSSGDRRKDDPSVLAVPFGVSWLLQTTNFLGGGPLFLLAPFLSLSLESRSLAPLSQCWLVRWAVFPLSRERRSRRALPICQTLHRARSLSTGSS